MVSDSYVRKLVYSSNLLDRTFYTAEECFPIGVSAQLKRDRAEKLRFRYNSKNSKPVTLKYIENFFKDVTVKSGGVIVVGHGVSKGARRYTQYFMGIVAESASKGIFEADIEFCVFWKKSFK